MGGSWAHKISHIKIAGGATCKAVLYQSADMGYSSHWTVAWRAKTRAVTCLSVEGDNAELNGAYAS